MNKYSTVIRCVSTKMDPLPLSTIISMATRGDFENLWLHIGSLPFRMGKYERKAPSKTRMCEEAGRQKETHLPTPVFQVLC